MTLSHLENDFLPYILSVSQPFFHKGRENDQKDRLNPQAF